MVWVPELPYATIIHAPKRACARRAPIRGQNRFPHREYRDMAVRMLLQNLTDCGGPPQTSRSSRREEQNDPHA